MFEYRITWYNEVDDKEEHIRGLVCGKLMLKPRKQFFMIMAKMV